MPDINEILGGPKVTLNFDALNMASRDEVSSASWRLIHQLQHEKPHIQILAAALLFKALTQRLQMNGEEMFHKAGRILRDVEFDKKANHRLAALRDYAAGELASANREV